MNEADRDLMIFLCTLKTGYGDEYYEKLNNKELAEEYHKQLEEDKEKA